MKAMKENKIRMKEINKLKIKPTSQYLIRYAYEAEREDRVEL
jgi:hypothetical protein